MKILALLAVCACIGVLVPLAGAQQPPNRNCQMDPTGWCAGEPDDTCGRNHFVWSCKLDEQCFGVPYQGESAVACKFDERGFGLNCPTVGCTSRKPKS